MKQVTEKEFFKFIGNIEHLTTRCTGNYPYTFECLVYGNLIAKSRLNDYFIDEREWENAR